MQAILAQNTAWGAAEKGNRRGSKAAAQTRKAALQMMQETFLTGHIPAVLYGEPSRRVYLFARGQYGQQTKYPPMQKTKMLHWGVFFCQKRQTHGLPASGKAR